jgi:hypothetical protein
MKGLKRLALLLTLAGCSVCTPAWAVLVTVDPDGYAPGTNLSNLIPGVSFSTFSSPGNGSFSFADVYSAEDSACVGGPGECKAVTGTKVFSRDGGGILDPNHGWFDSPTARRCFERVASGSCAEENFSALLISFADPTNYVEMSGWFTADWPLLYAYDASRNLIGGGTEEGAGSSHTVGVTRYQSSLSNISFVIAAGWAASSHLDVLRYDDMNTSVPEPGTALLFGLALLGFAAARRSRTVRAAS